MISLIQRIMRQRGIIQMCWRNCEDWRSIHQKRCSWPW